MNLKDNPDYCIINTCSVTSRSDYQSRQLIRRAYSVGAKVVVTGCYSELNREVLKDFKGIIKLVDNRDKMGIAECLEATQDDISSMTSLMQNQEAGGVAGYRKSRFFLKVQDGCDNECSYCIIPQARGRSRSIAPREIISKIDQISTQFHEIVLTGIHLGTYGYDLQAKVKLSDLIDAILSDTDIHRIRLSSLEVEEIDDNLLKLLQNPRICGHLHVPLQSGDDNILRAMNRRYTGGLFADKINDIAGLIPNVSIGSDVIVGFPGEGEREFDNTCRLIESLPLSYLHIFPYSDRPGTRAVSMQGKVDGSTKKRRCELLRQIDLEKRLGYMKSQVGRNLDMLIESVDGDNLALGTTGNYLRISANVRGHEAKNSVAVRVTGIREKLLLGVLIE